MPNPLWPSGIFRSFSKNILGLGCWDTGPQGSQVMNVILELTFYWWQIVQKNSAIVSYCFFFQTKREYSFLFKSTKFQVAKEPQFSLQGLFCKFGSFLNMPTFHLFYGSFCHKSWCFTLRSSSSHTPSLVSKENLGKGPSPGTAENEQRRWGGWGAGG